MFGPCDSIPSQRPRGSGHGDTWRWAATPQFSLKSTEGFTDEEDNVWMRTRLFHGVTETQRHRNPVHFLITSCFVLHVLSFSYFPSVCRSWQVNHMSPLFSIKQIWWKQTLTGKAFITERRATLWAVQNISCCCSTVVRWSVRDPNSSFVYCF